MIAKATTFNQKKIVQATFFPNFFYIEQICPEIKPALFEST